MTPSVGDRVLTLVVPQRVARGPATLRISLRDAAGNTLAATRAVRLPKR